jgi:lipoprotein-releasing system permease protein
MLVKGQVAEAVLLFGVDPEREARATALATFLDPAAIERLKRQPQTIVLGQGIAEKLGVAIDDHITVVVPDNASGRVQPRLQRFSVGGIIRSGTELDQSLALLRLEDAQQLSGGRDNAIALRVSVRDLFAAPQIAGDLWRELQGRYYVSDWTATQGNLYAAIHLSKQLVSMMLAIVIAVAAFNVVSALVLVVNDKQGDIAILRSQGATPNGIIKIFLVQGFLV